MRDTDTGVVETNSLKEEPQEKVKVVSKDLLDGYIETRVCSIEMRFAEDREIDKSVTLQVRARPQGRKQGGKAVIAKEAPECKQQ